MGEIPLYVSGGVGGERLCLIWRGPRLLGIGTNARQCRGASPKEPRPPLHVGPFISPVAGAFVWVRHKGTSLIRNTHPL